MGNLGLYQTMTTLAKKLGGPIQLAATVAVGGYLILRTAEAGVKLGINKAKSIKTKPKSDLENEEYYIVNSQGISNEGVKFNIGDKFRVLETDKDAVLIEIVGNENNPYFASSDFLKSISDYT